MKNNQTYTSCIHWFGSGGKKSGWIVKPEDRHSFETWVKYKNGYQVFQENIDQTLLDYIKQDEDFGKGVIVEFQLIESKQKKEAINVKLVHYYGTIKIPTSLTQDGEIQCEDDSDSVYIKNNNELQKDDIVSFGLKLNNDKYEAILTNKIEDKKIIASFLESKNPILFVTSLLANVELNLLSLEEIKLKLLERKEVLANIDILNSLIEKLPFVLISCSDLRNFINDPLQYSQLVNKFLLTLEPKLIIEILKELKLKIQSANLKEQLIYWDNIKYLQESLQYKGNLWDIAPENYKIQKIKEKYHKFFRLVQEFAESNYPDENKIQGNWKELYCLDQNEQKLISKWIESNLEKTNQEYNQKYSEFVKMVSARGAEKLVKKYYSSIGYQVTDVSLQQVLNMTNSDWEKYDIAIEKSGKEIFLDVKNARFSKNSKVYSSFCVKKFKKNCGQDVKIIGVLSPILENYYQEKNYIEILWYFSNLLNQNNTRKLFEETRKIINNDNNNQQINDNQIIEKLQEQKEQIDKINIDSIKLLGIFDENDINKLKQLFEIKEQFDLKIDVTYYPHWLFDYDDNFYDNQIKIINTFLQLTNDEIPSYQEFLMIEKKYNALPLFLASQRQLPNDWREKLPVWKQTFIDMIINLRLNKSRIKLSHIFLSILKHFLTMVINNNCNSNYNPKEYIDILYTFPEDDHPLKIYDPVKDQTRYSSQELPTIKNFCETLFIIYSRKENIKLNEFTKFEFEGKGLLRGIKNNQKTTILAYCKCGYRPLIRNEAPQELNICNECHWLICPKCQYCSSKWENKQKVGDCPAYIKRKQEKQINILGLNIVNLVGRVGGDPEVRNFDDGTIRCQFDLAVKRPTKKDDQPDWFTLKLWGENAKNAINYIYKGYLIGVKGSLIFEKWTDEKTGINRSKPVIQVQNFEVLSKCQQ